MKVSHLNVRDFRSLHRVDIGLTQICALVGPNNAGKSNLLLALRKVLEPDWLTKASFDQADIYGRDPNVDIEIELHLDPPLEYKRFKGGPPAVIAGFSVRYTRYKVGFQKGEPRLEKKCFGKGGKDVYVPKTAPKPGEQLDFEALIGIPDEIRSQVPLVYIGVNRSVRQHLPGARNSLLRPLFEDINKDFRDPSNTVVVKEPDGRQDQKKPRAEAFEELINQAMGLLRTKDFVELEESVKRNALHQLGFDPIADADKFDFFFSPFDSLDFYKSLSITIREHGFEIDATELGGGFQNSIVLAMLQAFEERRKKGAIFLIEEPEMFLHPQMQRSLYKTIREIGRTNQVVYSTHSPYFVAIPEFDEVLLLRRGSDGTNIQSSNLPTDAKRQEKLRKEMDPERSELFFAERLLLVEGDTEKLALPEYAIRLGIDLDRAGATIVEVGGKRNLMEFVGIAASFGIPTGVLYDEDSREFKDDRSGEKAYNAELDGLARSDGTVQVWCAQKNYEHQLRTALGEAAFQEMSQRFPRTTKPVKARLIAAENTPVPELVKRVVRWLGGVTVEDDAQELK